MAGDLLAKQAIVVKGINQNTRSSAGLFQQARPIDDMSRYMSPPQSNDPPACGACGSARGMITESVSALRSR